MVMGGGKGIYSANEPIMEQSTIEGKRAGSRDRKERLIPLRTPSPAKSLKTVSNSSNASNIRVKDNFPYFFILKPMPKA